MQTSKLENLLERLITVNEEMLEKLNHINGNLIEVHTELNWVEKHSSARMIYDGLSEISSLLNNIDINTTE